MAALDDETLAPIVVAGNRTLLDQESLTEAMDQVNGETRREFQWGNFWVLPLHRRRLLDMDQDELPPLLGLLGVVKQEKQKIENEQREALWLLADRAALALEDLEMQMYVGFGHIYNHKWK